MIIGKSRTGSSYRWIVYHKDIGNTHALYLNENFVKTDSVTFWNDTTPTSSVFSTVSNYSIGNDSKAIAYCFHDVTGYSKFGSYSGSGSQGSPSVNVGFKPDLLIVKRITGGAEQWWVGNSATNSSDHWTEWMPLQSNERLQSDTIHSITVTSNGFEPYGTSGLVNASGSSYLYLAFKINS